MFDLTAHLTPDLAWRKAGGAGGAAFLPTSLSGLQLWLDASDAASITISTGASVAQWNDKSGNSRHAVQATGARQPILETAAQNGNNLIKFTNTATGSESVLAFSRVSVASAFTLVAVVRMGTIGGTPRINPFGDSVAPADYPFEWFEDGTIYALYATGEVDAHSGLIPPSGCHTIIIPTGKILFDGADISIVTGSSGGASGFLDTIGNGDGSDYSQGEMAELMIYNRVLNSTETSQVQSYLKPKWATP